MRFKRLAFVLAPTVALCGLCALLPTTARAVGTRTFELETLEDLSGGDLKGVAVSSDGVVRAGWTLGSVPLKDATAAWSALTLADGSTLVGTSPEGKVFKVVGEEATLFAETGALSVTSIVQAANGIIYAATIAEGKIFRISQGKAELFATLPDTSNVWAIALDRSRTGLFAATGPEGKLFRVEPTGASSVYFKSDETNLVSVAVAASGDVYAGSSGKGFLYKISAPGRATVLYDFPGDPTVSVRAVALSRSGVVYAIANEESEPPEPSKRTTSSGRTPAAPVSTARPKPGKGSLYRFDPTGRPERMMHHDEFHYMSLAVDDAGQPFVGTGAEGRVYTVNDAHVVTLVADANERQIGAIALPAKGEGRGGLGIVVGSDPAVVHPIVGHGGAESVWTSKVLDAGLRARYGVLSWHASGAIELSTRTGNTQAPDGTWSTWSAPLAAPAVVPSPVGRFVQVRARWLRDPNASLGDLRLPFVTENVRPVVLSVDVASQQKPTSSGKDVPASGGEPPKHESVVKVSWKVDNADSDQLRYRVAFRREGQAVWRDIVPALDVFTKSEVDWDTQSLPEGHYRVRVEASDELANPPDQVQKHALESAPVLVDNTPPVFRGLALAGRRLRGRIVDGLGPIASVEVAIDGRTDWRPIGPADGLFDTADEAIDADLSTLVGPGSHIVAVRAFDAAGNAVVQDVETQ
jgi:hypothetical protein